MKNYLLFLITLLCACGISQDFQLVELVEPETPPGTVLVACTEEFIEPLSDDTRLVLHREKSPEGVSLYYWSINGRCEVDCTDDGKCVYQTAPTFYNARQLYEHVKARWPEKASIVERQTKGERDE